MAFWRVIDKKYSDGYRSKKGVFKEQSFSVFMKNPLPQAAQTEVSE